MTRSRLPDAIRAFRHPNFRLYFAGQFVSLSGTWMQTVAQSWLVYRLTGSAVMLGLVGFASQIPIFLLAPLGGVVADRYDRQRVLVLVQCTAMLVALTLAALTLSGRIGVAHVFVLAALTGAVHAFTSPTQSAFLVDLVGKADLMNAIALNSSMITATRIIGPAIAGVLVATIGEGWAFLVNGVSFVGVITALLLISVPRRARVAATGSALARLVEGFRFVAHTGPVRDLLLLLGTSSLFGMPYVVLMPIFADQVLGGGASGLGLLMAAAGAGSLIGALRLAARNRTQGLSTWVAIAAAAFGASLVLFSFSRAFWLSAALLVPAGLGMMIQMAATNTLVQSLVPDHLRGRVMSVYTMMFIGMTPLGALLAGFVAHRLGAPLTVTMGGSVCILAACLFWLRVPSLRAEARRILAANESAERESQRQ